MNNRITYLIGAGASYYSMPLVSSMAPRMDVMMEVLNPSSNITISGVRAESKILYSRYLPIITEIKKHYTPDTYAKKLWLNDDQSNLATLKQLLNLYFLFEQSAFTFEEVNKENTLSRNSEVLPNNTNTLTKMLKDIGSKIDFRYDVFLATLLDKDHSGNLLLPKNINIISWNYDNQWELAYNNLANKSTLPETVDKLNIFPELVDKNKSFDILNSSNILKLNGQCNNLKEVISIKKTNSIITEYKSIELLNFKKKITDLENGVATNMINFAWENHTNQKKAISLATQAIIFSNTLVIIGYSFPNFNRSIDAKILEPISGNQKLDNIYIQVPTNETYLQIRSRLLNIIKCAPEIITHIPDKDQFYIPY